MQRAPCDRPSLVWRPRPACPHECPTAWLRSRLTLCAHWIDTTSKPDKCFAEHDIGQRLEVRDRLEHASLRLNAISRLCGTAGQITRSIFRDVVRLRIGSFVTGMAA